jgi:hypothetical protein
MTNKTGMGNCATATTLMPWTFDGKAERPYLLGLCSSGLGATALPDTMATSLCT